jgi:hypothetical protein
MTFEEALRAELSSITGLSNKVFPLHAKEGIKAPYVIYLSSEGVRDKSFEGYLGTQEVECEINIIHSTYSNMKSLTKLVLNKIISFQGNYIGGYGPLIQNVSYEKPVELYENEVSLYRCLIDIKVRF